jgi:3-phosphoshikimate 1-carboxyvinyltransferase
MIIPIRHPITATISIPGSKSYTNRALILASLTKEVVVLQNPLYCDDTYAMIDCLRELGIHIETKPDQIKVCGHLEDVEDKEYWLFAKDSGTTVRFMLSFLSIAPGVQIIGGSNRLNERPISDLVDALRALGASITYCEKEGFLPVKIGTSSLNGNMVSLKADVSSQFCSSLLLISPFISNGFLLNLSTNLISKPYVDMTIQCMQDFGVRVDQQEGGSYFVSGGQSYDRKEYVIEGDFSSAGYFFAIAALTRSTIRVENINPFSLQADRKFLTLLEKMGNKVRYGETCVLIEGKQVIAMDLDMEDCPDQVMTMAVLCAFVDGVTKISGVRSLRVKESERVVALKNELLKMGINTEDTHDTLTIYGGAPKPATIQTYNDHRMAMAFAVAGIHLPGVLIEDCSVVNKTFPSFWDLLRSLSSI